MRTIDPPPVKLSTRQYSSGKVARWIAVSLTYLAVFLLLDRITHLFEIHPGVVPWYPPSGLTLALLIGLGWSFIPAVVIASLMSSLFVYHLPITLVEALTWAIIYASVYGLAAGLLRRVLRLNNELSGLRDVAYLIFVSSAAAAILATLSVTGEIGTGILSSADRFEATIQWWIGETVGTLTLAPAVLIFGIPVLQGFLAGPTEPDPAANPDRQVGIRGLVQAVSILIILYFSFESQVMSSFTMLYLLIVPLVWIALEHGTAGTSLAFVTISFGTALSMRVFNTPVTEFSDIQIFMLGVGATSLLTGALVTEYKRAQGLLRSSDERYYNALDQLMEGFQIIDRDWRYVYVNETVARQGKRSHDELINHTMMEMYPGIENTALFAILQKCMNERTAEQIENKFEFPDGSTAWFELSIEPVQEGICIVSIDITIRKKAEANTLKQLARLAALRDIDRAITSSTDFRVILNILLEKVIEHLKVEAADVMLIDPFTQVLEFAAGQGFRFAPEVKAEHLRMGEGLPGKVALERKPLYATELSVYRDLIAHKNLVDREGFKSYFGVPLIVKGKVIGVLEAYNRSVINPDAEWYSFLEALGGEAAITIDSSFLFTDLQRSNFELIRAYDSTIEGWSAALDLRDKETEGHTLRVTQQTIRLAETMGIRPEHLIHVRRGALLHDIGKMGVPDTILLKPGPLTQEEWVIMRKHPQLAHDLLAPIQYLQGAMPIPYCHHEKWDGTGYPRGLKGEQIPLEARIFAIIDVWDALTSDRPYRAAWSRDKALDYLKAESGKHFDPSVLETFLSSGLI
jgi:PAS domain S-box-containing protein/putative nucleotidyltransferase with HDIG domain